MTHKHGIACGTHDHAENGQPHVCHAHRWVHAISNTQHVAHSLKQRVGVLLTPSIILQGKRGSEEEEKQQAKEKEREMRGWEREEHRVEIRYTKNKI